MSGLIFPDRDHEPRGLADEYLTADMFITESLGYCVDELPPSDPYTGSTYALPISGDGLARVKQAVREGEAS